ncbi:distal tail protein Dit [Aquibacillus rhizosphaerae]|uniref:Phage tail family protein n=1 Tax=Aquibacillus rhizosphaerae TaxID=3051431 RepID=A0ABT7LE63_9BACI|nr:distal tail protein Dit [Aquibacillus sp. LR5S19]MDL4842841.1 phage tail family protein [Aquibacillus sp. LR5S19]
MYGFVDFNERGVLSTSLSIQTTFNSLNLDDMLTDDTGSFTTLTVSGRSNQSNRIDTTEVPGRDGLLESEEHTSSEREIVVKYQITDKTNAGFRQRCNRLNSLLKGSKKELVFSDEDAIFYATLSVNELPEENSNSLVGTITFLCSDPYKYGSEIPASFQNDIATITNEGTTEANPIFEMELLAPVTFAMIQNQDNEYMMVGKPLSIEDTVFEPEILILHDTMSTMTGWTQANYVDNGNISGEMVSDGAGMYPNLYGDVIEPPTWQGPSDKKPLSEPLQDFRAEIMVEQNNLDFQNGMLEIYFLDAADNTVAKIGIEDRWAYQDKNVGKFQLGPIDDRHNVSIEPNKSTGWNNFNGLLRIERIGNVWRPYWAIIRPDGMHVAVKSTVKYVDGLDKYAAPIAQIQVAMRKWPTTEATDQRVNDIKVYKINQEPDGIPYIAKEGDIITLDHKAKDILINGELRMDLINFGADFFKLAKGKNQLIVQPINSFITRVKYRERFK